MHINIFTLFLLIFVALVSCSPEKAVEELLKDCNKFRESLNM
jgi:hypothetical protein